MELDKQCRPRLRPDQHVLFVESFIQASVGGGNLSAIVVDSKGILLESVNKVLFSSLQLKAPTHQYR